MSELLDLIMASHDKINFWSISGNDKRLWREYKKKFGESRNAVKRRGHGPEVGQTETKNSSKEVLKRRTLSVEGVFAQNEKTLLVLSRKYNGGVVTEMAKTKEQNEKDEATAEAEAAELEASKSTKK